jgi:hypothetical protein
MWTDVIHFDVMSQTRLCNVTLKKICRIIWNSGAILKMPYMATSDENALQRNIIEYCVQLKMTLTQTLHQLQATSNNEPVSRCLYLKWHK